MQHPPAHRRVAILSPRIDEGDAVGNDAIGMWQSLKAAGYDARLFAGDWNTAFPVEKAGRLPGFCSRPDDLLIYHYSIAWDLALDLFKRLRCRRVIKFHNVTPPEFFDRYHSGIANSCRVGLQALGDFIATTPDRLWGDSQTNVNVMQEHRADPARCRVLPPFHQTNALLSLPPDLGVVSALAMSGPARDPVFLAVGRIVPNKGYHHLLRAFECYLRNYNPDARLVLVGNSDPQLSQYHEELDALMHSTGIAGSVLRTGPIELASLKAYFQSADLLFSLSEHEGFCVPIIEAMALGLPVVALGAAAVPDTAGDAAILWDKPDPEYFAASAHRVLNDEDLRFELVRRGHAHYAKRFAALRLETDFLELTAEVAQ